MADFKQAVKWMEEGKKVRVTNYIKGEYLFIEGNRFFDEEDNEYSLFVDDTLSTDWEIYEEKYDWNLKHIANYDNVGNYYPEAIETLKQKILEDLDKNSVEPGTPINVDESNRESINEILDKRFGF